MNKFMAMYLKFGELLKREKEEASQRNILYLSHYQVGELRRILDYHTATRIGFEPDTWKLHVTYSTKDSVDPDLKRETIPALNPNPTPHIKARFIPAKPETQEMYKVTFENCNNGKSVLYYVTGLDRMLEGKSFQNKAIGTEETLAEYIKRRLADN